MFNLFKKRLVAEKDISRLEIVSAGSPFAYAEAYRSLRTNLNFVTHLKKYRKLLLTSSLPNEGKSSVAINLAYILAENGYRVILIDCDLRNPMLHKYLRAQRYRMTGLSTVLSGTCTVEEAIARFSDLKFHLMTAGPIPPNPAELLASEDMGDLLDALAVKYDYVICDTPPVSLVTDAVVLSQHCDGTLLIVRQNYASFDEVKKTKRSLKNVNADIIGCVLNQYDISADVKISKYSGAYYQYEYSSKEGEMK